MFPTGYTHKNALPKRSVSSRTISDYSPFGVLLPERSVNAGDFRYGFQGQEHDDEVKGEGNSINFKYRGYDPRVGRFFAVDPLAKEYPWYTPYSFSGNEVINKIELEGLEPAEYLLAKNNIGKAFVAVSQASGQEGQKYYWKLASNPSKTAIWWEQGNRYVAPKQKPDSDPIEKELEQYNDISDNNLKSNFTPKLSFAPIVNEEKSAAEKFEDDLWNNGTIWEYVRFKANQGDLRYEGPKGLENFTRDGLVVVNTAGQVALFVPGGQVAGEMMMGFADLGETAFDMNDYGWKAGMTNGLIRVAIGEVGKTFIPEKFIGSKIFKSGYEGGVQVFTEITENQAVDYMNTFHKPNEDK